jgi:hypothetical protein
MILNNCLPSAKKTIDKDLLCWVFRVFFFWPSVFLDTRQRSGFAECYFFALGKELFCQVPEKLHSTNHLALGKEPVYGSDGHI